MIDLDLIQQTKDVVVDHRMYYQVTAAILIVAVFVFLRTVNLGVLDKEFNEMKDHPTIGWIASIAGINLGISAFTGNPIWAGIACAVLALGWWLSIRWLKNLSGLKARRRRHSQVAHESVAADRTLSQQETIEQMESKLETQLTQGRHIKNGMFSALALALVVVAAIITIPEKDIVEQQPTTVAMVTSLQASRTITNAVEDRYAVEVTGSSADRKHSPSFFDEEKDAKVIRHKDDRAFVEGALAEDPAIAPTVSVITDDGVYTSYAVIYDNEKQEATLIVSGDQTDTPVPKSLMR